MSTAATTNGGRRRRRKHPDALAVEEAKEMMSSWFPKDEDDSKEKRRKRKADDDGDHKEKAQEEGEEEEMSDSAAAIEDRVDFLKEIVKAMKSLDSSSRSCYALPTVDEQRLLNLILAHLDSCILLYYTLKMSSADPSDKELASVAGLRLSTNEELPHMGDVERSIDDIIDSHIWSIQKALVDCRRSICGADPWEMEPAIEKKLSHLDSLRPWPIDFARGGRVFRQLVDVLHTLQVLEQRRGYAPPRDEGGEIGCYKEIRKWTASSLIYTHSRKMNDPSLVDRYYDFVVNSYPLGSLCQGRASATHFFPFGHMFAIAFQLAPQYRDLFNGCKDRLSQVLLSGYDDAKVDDGFVDSGGEVQLMRWEPAEGGPALCPHEEESGSSRILKKTKLECLNIIVAKMDKCRSSTRNAKLNDREVQLYAHIAEHVRASIWLSLTTGILPDGESRMVNVADVKEIAPLGDGDGSYAREQYLEDIVSYMRAFKPIFSVDRMLTLQEKQAYYNIWGMLRSDFVWCSNGKPADPKRGKKRREPPSWLKEGLLAVHDKVNKLIREVKEESDGILWLVLDAVMPEVVAKVKKAATPVDAFAWFGSDKEEVASRLREFFQDKSSDGVALIDRLLVVLGELLGLQMSVLDKIAIASRTVDYDWHISKNFVPIEREVMNACYIMSHEN